MNISLLKVCYLYCKHTLYFLDCNWFGRIHTLVTDSDIKVSDIGIMVSVLSLGAVDCGFAPQTGQIKDYKIDMSTRRMLFQ